MRMPTNRDIVNFVKTYGLIIVLIALGVWLLLGWINRTTQVATLPAHDVNIEGIDKAQRVWFKGNAYRVTNFEVYEYTWSGDRIYIRLEEDRN